jgi:hypothetical protein
MTMAAIVFKKVEGKWRVAGRYTGKEKAAEIATNPKFQQYKSICEAKGQDVTVKDMPSDETMGKWSFDGVARTPDGCRTEPDGDCQHGWSSWLVYVGFI